ncbi:MAG: tetratricopeptide repeat protein [Myxococcota bacterium]|nr:tetratricopeptide repeat protein [Myxococcota bacterium]
MGQPYPFKSDDELSSTISALREDAAAARNLGIKTEHQVKSLAAEVRALSVSVEKKGRWSFLNTGIAYLVFTALACGGVFLILESQSVNQGLLIAAAKKKEQSYQREIGELRAQLGRWHQIERDLLEFERLITRGEKEAAVAKFSGLNKVKFRGLLEGLVDRFKKEVAEAHYKSGVDLFEKGSFGRAEAKFTRSVEYDEQPAYLGARLFHRGMTAFRLKDYTRAAQLLRTALDHRHGRKVLAEARYHLAAAHDRLGERRTARELYNRFVQRHSKHAYAAQAKRRHKQLSKRKRRR